MTLDTNPLISKSCSPSAGRLPSASRLLQICCMMVFLLVSADLARSGPAGGMPSSKTVVILRQGGADRMSMERQLVRLRVEVVSGQADMEKGLSGRDGLPDDAGMLFVLDPAHPSYFWMKGMNFPIDVLFFDRQKRLLSAAGNLQPCIHCAWVIPPAGTAYALEVNAGITEKLGIREGDRFAFGDE